MKWHITLFAGMIVSSFTSVKGHVRNPGMVRSNTGSVFPWFFVHPVSGNSRDKKMQLKGTCPTTWGFVPICLPICYHVCLHCLKTVFNINMLLCALQFWTAFWATLFEHNFQHYLKTIFSITQSFPICYHVCLHCLFTLFFWYALCQIFYVHPIWDVVSEHGRPDIKMFYFN